MLSSISPISAFAYIAALWTGSSIFYYLFLPAAGVNLSYNSSPLLITAFYLGWSAIAIFVFARILLRHSSRKHAFSIDLMLSAVFAAVASLYLLFFSYSVTPDVAAIAPATDLLLATPWYFLPKSADILFQQILIAAFVYSLAEAMPLKAVSLWYAIAFGGAHLLLFFGGSFPPAVFIMTLSAVVSAAFFPYLLMKVRYGFFYCYAIHWTYYALLAALLRIGSSAA